MNYLSQTAIDALEINDQVAIKPANVGLKCSYSTVQKISPTRQFTMTDGRRFTRNGKEINGKARFYDPSAALEHNSSIERQYQICQLRSRISIHAQRLADPYNLRQLNEAQLNEIEPKLVLLMQQYLDPLPN